MNRIHPFILSFFSGILLWAAWPVSPFTFVIFFAWIPLLLAADNTKKRVQFFYCSLFTMLVWNACTTWWIWNSTDAGSIGAIVANSVIMTLPWWGYIAFKKRYGNKVGLAALIIFWMSFEYIHLNWQLSWPWLTLGNVFASHPHWVEWYEYTGTSGGTLWVLLVNVVFFQLLRTYRKKDKPIYKVFTIGFVVLALPFVLSYVVKPLNSNQPFNRTTIQPNVIIVQPNIDPYNDKFDQATISAQIHTLIALSEQALDSNTRLVVWPETALPIAVQQQLLPTVLYYRPVFSFIKKHPQITLLTGIESYKIYGKEKPTPTARFDEESGVYYDGFNSAAAIKAREPLQFYNKSKLVPGVETLPNFLRWMSPIFEKFGGTTGGYGRSKEAIVFREKGNPYIAAPIICYESIYSEYVASYAHKGANLLTIITNDGWWGNTPGHKQHLQYARLRAIETRKWIARSANTGISAVIDNDGNIVQSQPWNEAAFIKAEIPPQRGETFYVEYGDILSKVALAFGGLMIVMHFYLLARNKFQKKNLQMGANKKATGKSVISK